MTTGVYLQHGTEHGELLRPLLTEPSLAAEVGKEHTPNRTSVVYLGARRLPRAYDLPLESALAACDLLLDLTSAVSRRLMETGEGPEHLENWIVQHVHGAALAVTRATTKKMPPHNPSPVPRRASRPR